MSVFASLKLVVAKKPSSLPAIVIRRNKVIARIAEQIALAQAQSEGRAFAIMQERTVTDAETGETRVVSSPKRVKQWWFVGDNGKLCVQLRYGAKLLMLGTKGQSAVELADRADLVPTLELLKQAVEAGELDAQIEVVSGAVKTAFKK